MTAVEQAVKRLKEGKSTVVVFPSWRDLPRAMELFRQVGCEVRRGQAVASLPGTAANVFMKHLEYSPDRLRGYKALLIFDEYAQDAMTYLPANKEGAWREMADLMERFA